MNSLKRTNCFIDEMKDAVSPSSIILSKTEIQNDDIDLICPICKGLLVSPNRCSICKKLFCQRCINSYICKYGTCPNKCTKITLIDIEEDLKAKLDSIIIHCDICEENISLFKYATHIQITHQKKCFNCGSITSKSNKKIKYLKYLKMKKLETKPSFHISNIPKEISCKLCFQIFVTVGNYRGFMALDDKGWLYLTKYRPSADYFSFKFDKGQQFIQIYSRKKSKWTYIGASYDSGIGIYEIGFGSIEIDPDKHEMRSMSGRTKELPLTLKMSNYYFFFYHPNDLYQACSVECLFPSDN